MRRTAQSVVVATFLSLALLPAGCERGASGPNTVFWGTYRGSVTSTVTAPPMVRETWTAVVTVHIGSDTDKKDEDSYLLIPSSEQTMTYVKTLSDGGSQEVTVTISDKAIAVDKVGPRSEISGLWTYRTLYEFSADYQTAAYNSNGSSPAGSSTSKGTLTRVE